jgi:hypothetical protein
VSTKTQIQQVVVYDGPKGKAIVYTTVYAKRDGHLASIDCVRHNPHARHVRMMPASDRMRAESA